MGSSSFLSERKKSVASKVQTPNVSDVFILNFSIVAPIWQSDSALRIFPSEDEKSNDTSFNLTVLSTFSKV